MESERESESENDRGVGQGAGGQMEFGVAIKSGDIRNSRRIAACVVLLQPFEDSGSCKMAKGMIFTICLLFPVFFLERFDDIRLTDVYQARKLARLKAERRARFKSTSAIYLGRDRCSFGGYNEENNTEEREMARIRAVSTVKSNLKNISRRESGRREQTARKDSYRRKKCVGTGQFNT